MTTTSTQSTRKILDNANPQYVADALQKVKLGTLLSPLKVTVTGLTATQAIDITSADVMDVATINVGGLAPGRSTLPPLLMLRALRVTASGTAGSLGVYVLGDSGATPIVPPGGAGAAAGIAKISEDGKTITFPNTITGFVIEYVPQPDTDMEAAFATTT